MESSEFVCGFPPEFDPSFYRATYPDLAGMSDAVLWDHYERFGRSEGRRATAAVPRANFLSFIPPNASILEIGPYSNPVASGPNVRYFDVLSTEGLRTRAAAGNRDASKVPHIDFVSPCGNLGIIDIVFDVVISSHSIEHQPDLVAHLRNVAKILAPAGCYLVIMPDSRYCFDHHIAPSSIARVLDAHYSERQVHTLASIIEHRSMTAHNDSAIYWNEKFATMNVKAAKVGAAIEEWKHSKGGYVDVHAWQFTPASFKEIINLLSELNEIELFPRRVYDTIKGSSEFCAVLQKVPTSAGHAAATASW